MGDIHNDGHGWDVSGGTKKEWEEEKLNRYMSTILIDDDLDFDPYTVESLVAVPSERYGTTFFARFFNGTIAEIDGKQFQQILWTVRQGRPVADVPGKLTIGDANYVSLWITDLEKLAAFERKRPNFSWDAPVWKIWRWLDTKCLV